LGVLGAKASQSMGIWIALVWGGEGWR
jgi:hypothetical protein